MKLPNLDRAIASQAKVKEYLLFEEKSGGKTAFFQSFGFSVAEWEILAKALHAHAAENEVTLIVESEYGTKYVVDGLLKSPDERNPMVRAIWIVDIGTDFARLVTAYPA
jgi:hypothetical protein